MILAPKYCWERIQKHQITIRTQYHDLRGRIGPHMAGNRNKHVKILKVVQNFTFSALFGGGLVQRVYRPILEFM